MARLLLGELVGPKQNSPVGRSRAATQLRLRESSSLVEGVVLLRLARMGKKRWRALARAVPLGPCGYESLDGVDGDGSHASYRVGLEGGDRR